MSISSSFEGRVMTSLNLINVSCAEYHKHFSAFDLCISILHITGLFLDYVWPRHWFLNDQEFWYDSRNIFWVTVITIKPWKAEHFVLVSLTRLNISELPEYLADAWKCKWARKILITWTGNWSIESLAIDLFQAFNFTAVYKTGNFGFSTVMHLLRCLKNDCCAGHF